MNLKKNITSNGFLFAVVMWLSSRIVIIIAMLLIAPSLPVPSDASAATFSWDVFSAWDSEWYRKIVTYGYEYINDGKQHSIAFFPLFPLLIRAIMSFGLSFEMAGTLLNNLAFLAALIVLYVWVEERNGKSAARWTTAVLAWCPYSIYSTVIYTEGLFLLCSTAALRAFDKQQYTWVAFWGALSTATRSPGLALIPAFLFASWQQRRGIKAYIASLAVGLGVFLYSLYCQIQFGDALAFVHVQKGWRTSAGFAWQGWLMMLRKITLGNAYWQFTNIQDLWYPLLLMMIIVSGFLLWRFRQQLGYIKVRYGFYLLWFFMWFLAEDELVRFVLIFGGLLLLWFSRAKIPLAAVVYGFFSYALILNTGLTASVERYAYGIVSLSFAFGLLLARYPRWGYAVIIFFAIFLANLSVQFAQNQWIA
ncbi:mannosyltransferase family protein [Halotia branconii]|uniref:Mannosyltransferase family protein n=1 Tax=Halotia branconii CENA392 TaxID=1539056 RepID=A0AAJ6P8D0_9CYAN|nr:mannosyltransferase family protein [Halotia branconii]WGV24551.1 mannosyltransferase family protein [Halotia branconii CENA392]